MKTSVHIGGFWFHIDWSGETGKDQHGHIWHDRDNPQPENKLIKEVSLLLHDIIMLTFKTI